MAVGGNSLSSGNILQVYQFDRASGVLTLFGEALPGGSQVNGVHWSPDGQYALPWGVTICLEATSFKYLDLIEQVGY